MSHRDISHDIVLKTSHNIALKTKARFLTCIFEKNYQIIKSTYGKERIFILPDKDLTCLYVCSEYKGLIFSITYKFNPLSL